MQMLLVENGKIVYAMDLDKIRAPPNSPSSNYSAPTCEIDELLLDTPCPPGKMPAKNLAESVDRLFRANYYQDTPAYAMDKLALDNCQIFQSPSPKSPNSKYSVPTYAMDKLVLDHCEGNCSEKKKGVTHRFPCVFRLAKK